MHIVLFPISGYRERACWVSVVVKAYQIPPSAPQSRACVFKGLALHHRLDRRSAECTMHMQHNQDRILATEIQTRLSRQTIRACRYRPWLAHVAKHIRTFCMSFNVSEWRRR
jgi:hypothetical protein